MGCCSSFAKCFLLFLAVVLGVLCIAGAVVFCALYYQFAVQMGVRALEARISDLQSQLNQSQSEMIQLEAQISSTPTQFEAQVQMFQNQFDQFMTDTNSDLDSQTTQAQADFVASLADSGIDNPITTAEQHRSTFLNNVATTLSNQLTQVNNSLKVSLGSFITDFADFEDQLRNDWADTINSVNARILASGEHKTYIRFGNSTCPEVPGTSLVYSGYGAGTVYWRQGGGSNILCLPSQPEYVLQDATTESVVYGSEYESVFLGSANENVPCAVCSVANRPEVIMIPAKVNCPASWTKEYDGYLMSENQGSQRTSFICVDQYMEFIAGKTGHMDGCDLWIVEASCNNLPCPPYNDEAEMSCVVCSK